jgi:putative heme-binding domain-containing protein
VFSPRRRGARPAAREVRPAWDSTDPGCREAWLGEVEGRLATDSSARERAFALARDPDARVRFEAALALGELGDAPALPAALAAIARAGANDRWTRAAVLSSASQCSAALLDNLLEQPDTGPDLLEETARVVAGAAKTRVAEILNSTRFKSAGFEQRAALCAGFERLPDEPGLTTEAAAVAADPNRATESRLRAIRVLAFDKSHREGLQRLVNAREPDAVQTACVRALQGEVAPLLERGRWLSLTPAVHEAVIGAFLTHGKSAALLDAIESGVIPPAALNPARRDALMKDRSKAIAERAQALFAVSGGADRMKVYEDVKPRVLALTGSASGGRSLFAVHCATCHRLDQQGIAVGPDLFDIRNQPKETILLHLIVPNREIYSGFNACTVRLNDGRVLTGLISSESPTALTLRMAGGIEEVLLRRDVESIEASATSLMPDGLEQTLTARELADLLAHLRGE